MQLLVQQPGTVGASLSFGDNNNFGGTLAGTHAHNYLSTTMLRSGKTTQPAELLTAVRGCVVAQQWMASDY
jgi:hypothetical protein